MLIVGASDDPRVLMTARTMPDGGLLICLDGDRQAAARATEAFARAGVGGRAHVMIGDPALFLRKVAGPFDLILTTGDHAARLGDALRQKLAPGGALKDL